MVTFWLILILHPESRRGSSVAVTDPQEPQPFLPFAAVRFGGKKKKKMITHKSAVQMIEGFILLLFKAMKLSRGFTWSKIMSTEQVGKDELANKSEVSLLAFVCLI